MALPLRHCTLWMRTNLKRDKNSKPEGVFWVQVVTFLFKTQFSIVTMLTFLQGVRQLLQGDLHIAEQIQFSVIFNLIFKNMLIFFSLN